MLVSTSKGNALIAETTVHGRDFRQSTNLCFGDSRGQNSSQLLGAFATRFRIL